MKVNILNGFSLTLMAGIMMLGLTLGCNSSSSESAEEDAAAGVASTMEEVMAIHDEVMPKMGELNQLKESLEKKAETMEGDDPSKSAVIGALGALETADEAMMDWMRNFEPPVQGDESDEVLNYLKIEKEKISEVRDQMLESMAKAKSLLEE